MHCYITSTKLEPEPLAGFNSDFILNLSDSPREKGSLKSYAYSALPNIIGPDIFVSVRKSDELPVKVESLNLPSAPISLYLSYFEQLRRHIKTRLASTDSAGLLSPLVTELAQLAASSEYLTTCVGIRLLVIDEQLIFAFRSRRQDQTLYAQMELDVGNVVVSANGEDVVVEGWIAVQSHHSSGQLNVMVRE